MITGGPAEIADDLPATPELQLRRARAGPLSRYLLVLAVLAVAAAIFVTNRRPDQVAVLVATRDVPAYQTIAAGDVTLGLRAAAQGYASLPVAGRLSLRGLTKGQPLRQADIAPDVAAALGPKLVVQGFPVAPATVLDGALSPGERIQVVLVRGGRKLAQLDAVVLSVSGADPAPTRTLVVAIRRADAKADATAIAVGTASVSKNPAASGAPG